MLFLSSCTTTTIPPHLFSYIFQIKWIHAHLICFFYYRLFEEHTELLDLFEKFKTLRTKEEQESSLELAEHASMVMSTLDHAVRTLESPDEFVQFVENVGQSHNRIPGFKRDYFWVSKYPLTFNPFISPVESICETTRKWLTASAYPRKWIT